MIGREHRLLRSRRHCQGLLRIPAKPLQGLHNPLHPLFRGKGRRHADVIISDRCRQKRMLVADDHGTGRHCLEEAARHDARIDMRLRREHQTRPGFGDFADDRAAVEGQRSAIALVVVPEFHAADFCRAVDIQHALLIEFTQDSVVPRRLVGQLFPVDAAIKDAVFVMQPGWNDRIGKRVVQQRHVRGDEVSSRGTYELFDLGRAGVGVDVV